MAFEHSAYNANYNVCSWPANCLFQDYARLNEKCLKDNGVVMVLPQAAQNQASSTFFCLFLRK